MKDIEGEIAIAQAKLLRFEKRLAKFQEDFTNFVTKTYKDDNLGIIKAVLHFPQGISCINDFLNLRTNKGPRVLPGVLQVRPWELFAKVFLIIISYTRSGECI